MTSHPTFTTPPGADRVATSLMKAIAASDLPDLTADMADALMSSGADTSASIPVIAPLVHALRLVGSISNYIFVKKVVRFLLQLRDVSDEDRKAFVGDLHASPDDRERVGEVVMLLLDRLDDVSKADIAGLFFKRYITGRIDLATFRRLGSALEKVGTYHLDALRTCYTHATPGSTPQPEVMQEFASAGLVGLHFSGAINSAGGRYERNELGTQFVRFAFPR